MKSKACEIFTLAQKWYTQNMRRLNIERPAGNESPTDIPIVVEKSLPRQKQGNKNPRIPFAYRLKGRGISIPIEVDGSHDNDNGDEVPIKIIKPEK